MTSNTDEHDFLIQIPKTIGSYEIISEICSSFLGGVCTAIHSYTDEQVAIKIFSKSSLQMYKSELLLINNEISVLKILNHKNIISLYEVFESPTHIYLITEYCPGKELFDVICTKKRLTESEAKEYFYQIISALDYMHSMNICHRNIKPENIVFDSKGIIKLIDFDFSCYYLNKETNLNEELGTPSYACPEIHKGENYKPELADIWSCGILLYVMVCGNCPFNDDETENIIQGNFEIPPYINNTLSDLIQHMIEPNPFKRYTFKDVFKHEWLSSSFYKNKHMNKGVNYFTMKYPIDSRILNICETYGFNRDKIKNDLINNKFNSYTAMYKLCVKKVYNVGISCLNDFSSDEYNAYIEDKGNYYSEQERKEILKRYETKEKERLMKIKEQEREMINKEEKAFKELNEIDKENEDNDLLYTVNEGNLIKKLNDNLLLTLDNNNSESYSEDDNHNNDSSSEYGLSSRYSYEINTSTQVKENNSNISDIDNKSNKFHLKESNSYLDSSFEICSAFPSIQPKSKLMNNLIKKKFSLISLNPNNIKSQPNIKYRKNTLNPNKYKRYPAKRRNALINRNEIEQTIRAYRTDLNLETSEESDDNSYNDESNSEHSSLELSIKLAQTHNKDDSDYYENMNNIPKDLNQNESEYYNKLALELIEKEKREEEKRQRIIIEDKKRYDEEQKRKQQEQLQKKKEEEKANKEEMRRKLQQRRLIAQIIHNVNRSQSLDQQNKQLQLLGKAVDERNITLQTDSRSSSFTKRVNITFSEIKKLIKNAAKDIKTRRFSMKLSTNRKIYNANVARARLRKTTVAGESQNMQIPSLIIFEFPEEDDKQKRYSYIKTKKQNKLTKNENKINSFISKEHNNKMSINESSQIKNINDTSLITVDTNKIKKRKKKGEMLPPKLIGDKYNKMFIAELEELKMKTKEDEMKFKQEIEKLEKLKENQNEKYQIQMILIAQEKLRKLKENKQLIKKLEKEVIRENIFVDMNNGVYCNKHNKQMNKKQRSKKKEKVFLFDKDVTKLPGTINENKTSSGINVNAKKNSEHKGNLNINTSKQRKLKLTEQKILELINKHSNKKSSPFANASNNNTNKTKNTKNNILHTQIPSNSITPKASHSKNNKNYHHNKNTEIKPKQQTLKLEKNTPEIKLKVPKSNTNRQDKNNITSNIVNTSHNTLKNSNLQHESYTHSKNKKEKEKEKGKKNTSFIHPQPDLRNSRVNPSLNNYNYKINFFHQQPDLNLSFSFLNAQNATNINQTNNLNNQEFSITNTSNFCIENHSSTNIHLAEELNNCFTDKMIYNTKRKIKSTLYKNNSKETSLNFTEYKDKASLLKNTHIKMDSIPIQEKLLKKEQPNKSNLTKSIDIYNNETNNETFTSLNNSNTTNSKYIHNIKSTLLNRINKSKQIKHSHYKSVFNSLTNNCSDNNHNNSSNSLNKTSVININKHSVGKINSSTSTKTPIKQNDCFNRNCNNCNNNSIPNLINKSMIQRSSYSNYNSMTTSTQFNNLISPSIINSNKLSVYKSTKTKSFINKTIHNTENHLIKSNTSRINPKSDNNHNNKINKRNNKTLLPLMTTTNIKEPTYYEGLIDISCISILNLKETINKLITKLKKNTIYFMQANSYVYRCNKKKTSFDVEICQIYNKMYYYMIKVKSGVNIQKELIAQILSD